MSDPLNSVEQRQITASHRLNHPDVVDYFTRNAHRMAAFRALLEFLSTPLPDWAKRGVSGPGAAARRDMMTAFTADNPERPNYTLAPRSARPARS